MSDKEDQFGLKVQGFSLYLTDHIINQNLSFTYGGDDDITFIIDKDERMIHRTQKKVSYDVKRHPRGLCAIQNQEFDMLNIAYDHSHMIE